MGSFQWYFYIHLKDATTRKVEKESNKNYNSDEETLNGSNSDDAGSTSSVNGKGYDQLL